MDNAAGLRVRFWRGITNNLSLTLIHLDATVLCDLGTKNTTKKINTIRWSYLALFLPLGYLG
jgi:hypothetical protein